MNELPRLRAEMEDCKTDLVKAIYNHLATMPMSEATAERIEASDIKLADAVRDITNTARKNQKKGVCIMSEKDIEPIINKTFGITDELEEQPKHKRLTIDLEDL